MKNFLLMLFITLIFSLTGNELAFAATTPTIPGTGAANMIPKMAPSGASTSSLTGASNVSSQISTNVQLATEYHYVSTSTSAASYQASCPNGGSILAAPSGSGVLSYTCAVPIYPWYLVAGNIASGSNYNANYAIFYNESQGLTKWTNPTSNASEYISTKPLQPTTYMTTSCFPTWQQNSSAWATLFSSATMSLGLNSNAFASEVDNGASGATTSTGCKYASTTARVFPGQTLTVTINYSGWIIDYNLVTGSTGSPGNSSTTASCSNTYTVGIGDIGNTVNLSCCTGYGVAGVRSVSSLSNSVTGWASNACGLNVGSGASGGGGGDVGGDGSTSSSSSSSGGDVTSYCGPPGTC